MGQTQSLWTTPSSPRHGPWEDDVVRVLEGPQTVDLIYVCIDGDDARKQLEMYNPPGNHKGMMMIFFAEGQVTFNVGSRVIRLVCSMNKFIKGVDDTYWDL